VCVCDEEEEKMKKNPNIYKITRTTKACEVSTKKKIILNTT